MLISSLSFIFLFLAIPLKATTTLSSLANNDQPEVLLTRVKELAANLKPTDDYFPSELTEEYKDHQLPPAINQTLLLAELKQSFSKNKNTTEEKQEKHRSEVKNVKIHNINEDDNEEQNLEFQQRRNFQDVLPFYELAPHENDEEINYVPYPVRYIIKRPKIDYEHPEEEHNILWSFDNGRSYPLNQNYNFIPYSADGVARARSLENLDEDKIMLENDEGDDMDVAESSAAIFRPFLTYRKLKAKRLASKGSRRRSGYVVPKRRKTSTGFYRYPASRFVGK